MCLRCSRIDFTAGVWNLALRLDSPVRFTTLRDVEDIFDVVELKLFDWQVGKEMRRGHDGARDREKVRSEEGKVSSIQSVRKSCYYA